MTCVGEENHVCVRVCLCVLRARVKRSRGELRPPPAATGPQGSCCVLWASLGGPVEPVWDLGRSCGLLGASWAPGEGFDKNQLITGLVDSCCIFWGSLGDHFELVREWGRSCGLLGDFLGSRAPGEDFKGAGGSRGHT